MSTGLDCYIEEREDGFYFAIEDPNSNRMAPEFIEEGPFATPEEMRKAYRRHVNPGGFSLDLLNMSNKEFDRRFYG